MSDELVQFLRERLDQDDQAARAATPGPWKLARQPGFEWVSSAEYWAVADCSDADPARENAEHIARHDPARVLAEVDAKRQLMAALTSEGHATLRPGGSTEVYCGADYGDGSPCDCGRDERVSRSLRVLASVYADHPDYRAEWRAGEDTT
jgi:hypothetical protein